MKRNFKALLLAMALGVSGLVLSACALGTSTLPTTTSTPILKTTQAAEPIAAVANSLLGEYYTVQSEKDSYKLDKDTLKQQKELGRIGRDEYKQKRLAVEQKIYELERKTDQIKAKLTLAGWDILANIEPINYGAMDDAALRISLYALRDERDSLDKKQTDLGLKYRNGQIDRAEFVGGNIEFERQDDEIYARMQPLVKELERRGRSAWTQWYHVNERKH